MTYTTKTSGAYAGLESLKKLLIATGGDVEQFNKIQTNVLLYGNSAEAYVVATFTHKADVLELAKRVSRLKDPAWIYYFLDGVPKAPAEILCPAVIESGGAEWAYKIATKVPVEYWEGLAGVIVREKNFSAAAKMAALIKKREATIAVDELWALAIELLPDSEYQLAKKFTPQQISSVLKAVDNNHELQRIVSVIAAL